MNYKYKPDDCKRKGIIRPIDQSIQRLPVEIILKIFDYLSPRQLCTCSYVCKHWYKVASSNEIWRKVFQYYHINRPSRDNVTFKQEFIKRSREYMREKLLKEIDVRNQQQMFPDFLELRKLDISILGEIFDYKNKSINRNTQRIKSIICDCNTGVRFNWQRIINCGQLPGLDNIASVSINILVPGLIKNLLPIQETINNHIKMLKFDLRASIRRIISCRCECRQYSNHFSSTIEWHFCVPTMLIGLWPSDQMVAYLCCFLSLMDMQAITEKLFFGGRHDGGYLTPNPRLTEPNRLRFHQPNYTTDLKCTLILENIEPSKILLVRSWMSLDCVEGKPFDLVKEYDEYTHLQMNDDIVFKPSIGHLHLQYKNILKVEVLIVSARNFPLWSYSAAVVITPAPNINGDCGPSNGRWLFIDAVIKGTLTMDNSGRMYLTHFCIR